MPLSQPRTGQHLITIKLEEWCAEWEAQLCPLCSGEIQAGYTVPRQIVDHSYILWESIARAWCVKCDGCVDVQQIVESDNATYRSRTRIETSKVQLEAEDIDPYW